MRFFKEKYFQNYCRFCKKLFCCENCRVTHEIDTHKIHPDCGICIYGNMHLSTASEDVIRHVEETHWPLHCILCKNSFASMSEIREHNKCSVGLLKVTEVASKTPAKVVSTDSDQYDSPDINNICVQFFSSTPTQVERTEHFPNTITPVEENILNKIKHANENLSSYTPQEIKKTSNKRRVTFGQTPQSNQSTNKDSSGNLKGSLKKLEPQQLNLNSVDCTDNTDNHENTDPQYFTAKTENECSIETITRFKQRRSYSMTETLWESALNFENNITDCNLEKEEKKCIIIEHNEIECTIENNTSECSVLDDLSVSNSFQKMGSIWSLMKNVVRGFSGTVPCGSPVRQKRHLSQTDNVADVEMQQIKRIKLTDIKCRPPIRRVPYYYYPPSVMKVDKSTQTEPELLQIEAKKDISL